MAKRERNVLYAAEYKRTGKMISDFVKFTYRQRFPKVSRNFMIVGLLSIVFVYGGRIRAVQIICLVLGIFCILMSLFRHHIPISMMKRRDPDYLQQNTLSYEFTGHDITGLRNGEPYIEVNGYKNIHHVYHDEEYFFIGVNEEDLIVLPKDRFICGDPEDFCDYIRRKTGLEPVWVPAARENRKEKSRTDRARRAAKAEEMQKQRAEEMQKQRAEMREAFRKAREEHKAKRESEQ